MSTDEILAKIIVLEQEVVKLQRSLQDLRLQIREGLDND